MTDHSFYNDLLVLFSIVIAWLSCFIALDLSERIVLPKGVHLLSLSALLRWA